MRGPTGISRSARILFALVFLVAVSGSCGDDGDISAPKLQTPSPATETGASRAPFDEELRSAVSSSLLSPMSSRVIFHKEVRAGRTACYLASVPYRGRRSHFAGCLEQTGDHWVPGPPIGELFTATPYETSATFARPSPPGLVRWLALGSSSLRFFVGFAAPEVEQIEALDASGAILDEDHPAARGEVILVVDVDRADLVVMRDERNRVLGLDTVSVETLSGRSSMEPALAIRFVEAITTGDGFAAEQTVEEGIREGKALKLLIAEAGGAQIGRKRPDADGTGHEIELLARGWKGWITVDATDSAEPSVWRFTFTRQWLD